MLVDQRDPKDTMPVTLSENDSLRVLALLENPTAPGAAFQKPPGQHLRIPMQLVPGNRIIFLRHQNILPPVGTR